MHLKTHQNIISILIYLDSKEIMVGDLSFDNILLDNKKQLFFIDLEFYRLYSQNDNEVPGTVGFWCRDYSEKKAIIYALFSIWYYLLHPNEYRDLLSSEPSNVDSNLNKYKTICKNAEEIIELTDYNLALIKIKNLLEDL